MFLEIETISNDHERFAYVEGHRPLDEFAAALEEDGSRPLSPPRHIWLVEKPVPDHHRDEFSTWFTLCDEEQPGAFPVTCATIR